ncbi:MAG: radical SAM protein [Candidatus Sabulitectum sp.]|nr:radical SAM protein [Candidatus Sabulitectum sp.]
MKYHIISLGCPKNKVDSERFAWVMSSAGWKYCVEPDPSDLIILNTCAFIAPATEESLEYLSDIISWKGEKPGRKVVLAGCLPGRYRDDGSGGLENIDLVIGPGDWRKLSAWLGGTADAAAQVLGQGSYRYLKIANGCSNNCAYCTIPAIRGKFVARGLDTILMESDLLVQQGAREIGLVAQDSGNWQQNGTDLSFLAETLAARHPSIWWRLYYLHPLHFPCRLPEVFSKYSNVVPYIDMPIQHASDSILERMGRRHGVKTIEKIMEQLDSSPVEIAVRYTVITGYPGETETDFRALRDFLGRYRSGRHIAAFSWYPEEGTLEYSRAIARGDAVDDSTASRRLAAISAVGDALYADWDDRLYGRELSILADDRFTGHTMWDAPEVDAVVSFTQPVSPGSIIRSRITESSGAVLVAEPVN